MQDGDLVVIADGPHSPARGPDATFQTSLARSGTSRSAWGRPPGAVSPRPTISPVALTTTQPTEGFGQVVPRPRLASARACAMWDSSLALMCRFYGSTSVVGGSGLLGRLAAGQLAEQSLEVLGLAEVLVDRCKPYIGHIVERLQRFHHQPANRL